MPPVLRFGAGTDVALPTAALKPMVTPSTLVKRTTCSMGVPSVPVTELEREVTA
ncbi:hypothetical protein SALBM311S_11259 [Streptomyces alboniger]